MTVLFRGRVQGVGFRFTTQAIAADFPVTGQVRNLSDGRVELVAEGPKTALDGFLDALHRRMVDHISGVDAATSPATGEFSGFGIAG